MTIVPNVIATMLEGDDRTYMEGLYLKYHRLMYAAAWKFFQEQYTVEDIVSTACIALMRNLSTLRKLEEPQLRVYIVAAVRSASINHYNNQKRISERFASVDASDIENAPDDFNLESRFEMEDELGRVLEAMKRLPEKEQMVIRMKYAEGMRDEEIAAVVGLSPNSIRKYVSRARRKLIQMLYAE